MKKKQKKQVEFNDLSVWLQIAIVGGAGFGLSSLFNFILRWF